MENASFLIVMNNEVGNNANNRVKHHASCSLRFPFFLFWLAAAEAVEASEIFALVPSFVQKSLMATYYAPIAMLRVVWFNTVAYFNLLDGKDAK